MGEVQLLHNYLVVGALLFGIGLVGLLARRNMIVMFLCAEMMLQGVSLSLVAWGRYHNNFDGQVLVIVILTVAACEAATALALVLMLYHHTDRLDIADWQSLREANQPAFIDEELPADIHPKPEWPELTPAGREAPLSPEKQDELRHRLHV
ncbi:MAG: NADH-quinone oxidoreductase subunit NuoK [Planctomycetes bacterium]|nr:NADH-quinone oxidoreductase subunit NuoK [Planctomycetota bacterium]